MTTTEWTDTIVSIDSISTNASHTITTNLDLTSAICEFLSLIAYICLFCYNVYLRRRSFAVNCSLTEKYQVVLLVDFWENNNSSDPRKFALVTTHHALINNTYHPFSADFYHFKATLHINRWLCERRRRHLANSNTNIRFSTILFCYFANYHFYKSTNFSTKSCKFLETKSNSERSKHDQYCKRSHKSRLVRSTVSFSTAERRMESGIHIAKSAT